MSGETMAEVLAEHHPMYKWDRDFGENVWVCTSLGCVFGTDSFERAIAHQADALTAAGFGLVADAKAEALAKVEEIAKGWDVVYEKFPFTAAGIFAKSHATRVREAMGGGDE